MARFKITIQYDGTKFFGWQFQPEKRTVQDELEKVISTFSDGEKIKVFGAGRTDTGVHALSQVAHFDLNTDLDTCNLIKALNAHLSEDILVESLDVVPADFHARYSAQIRYYRYQCYTGNNVLFRNQSWITGQLDQSILQSVAETVVGEHDFLSFCKFRIDMKSTVCKIYESVWKKQDKMLIYYVSGNRFLHHMVRYLTGTMVEISREKFTIESFLNLLNNPEKNVQIFKAPPQGLILEKVDYA